MGIYSGGLKMVKMVKKCEKNSKKNGEKMVEKNTKIVPKDICVIFS